MVYPNMVYSTIQNKLAQYVSLQNDLVQYDFARNDSVQYHSVQKDSVQNDFIQNDLVQDNSVQYNLVYRKGSWPMAMVAQAINVSNANNGKNLSSRWYIIIKRTLQKEKKL